ncbi:MAG: DUF971 domain-containing protein [Ignavibacteria bacterium]|nr:DUF971 domain-containing protein [Ignavibacteria bacterium]
MAVPKKIELIKQESLKIVWDDNRENIIPLKYLRDESPDAQNKGETILWKHYAPPPAGPDKPGKYEVEKIQLVGNYGIQITWKDGYDYGIFDWELLNWMAEKHT